MGLYKKTSRAEHRDTRENPGQGQGAGGGRGGMNAASQEGCQGGRQHRNEEGGLDWSLPPEPPRDQPCYSLTSRSDCEAGCFCCC